MIRSYLRMAGVFEDGGVLADGYLEPAGVLQGARQVKCLFAVAVVLALAAREQEDFRSIGRLLLSHGRRRARQRTSQGQANHGDSVHGSGSCPDGPLGRISSVGIGRLASGYPHAER